MFEIIDSHYHRQVDHLKTSFDLTRLQWQVATFILVREGMRQHDQDIFMMTKNLTDELGEVQEELELYGTPSYNSHAAETESMDAGFFPMATAVSNKYLVDRQDVMPYVNGVGSRSDITDRLKEIGGNIEKKTFKPDVNFFLRHYVAFIAGMPAEFDPQNAMADVLDKNDKNYPAEFFNGIHPITKKLLNPDELDLQYQHSRKCFKLIRLVHRQLLGHSDRDYGLEKQDWQRHGPLIADFENAEIGFINLLMKVSGDHQLSDKQMNTLKKKFIKLPEVYAKAA